MITLSTHAWTLFIKGLVSRLSNTVSAYQLVYSYKSLFAMKLKKLHQSIATSNRNELWKTDRWTSFQNPQLQSILIFFNFIRSLLQFVQLYFALSFIPFLSFWAVIIMTLNLVTAHTVWNLINFVAKLIKNYTATYVEKQWTASAVCNPQSTIEQLDQVEEWKHAEHNCEWKVFLYTISPGTPW